jgi:hypothetical protein
MSAERINPESSTDNVTSREVTVPFRVPLAQEAGLAQPVESKSRRNRKKRKRQLNSAVAEQRVATKPKQPQEAKPRSKGVLAMDAGEFTLWQRPDDPQSQASAKLGEKVVGVAGRERPHAAKEPEETEEKSAPTERKTEVPEQQPIQPIEWLQQPMIQHQAGEQRKPAEADEEATVAKTAGTQSRPETPANGPNPFEQSYQPVPPPQPPDPLSYRRRFWNESPVPAPDGSDNANALPPPHTYEYLPQEPPYTGAGQRVEAPASVPSGTTNKYESDIPPGYQRSPADVSRAAWTGLLAGWWIGRRGKRKAVERARQAGVKQGMETATARQPAPERRRRSPESPYAAPRLEAEPIHTYPTPETGRTIIQPISAEARNPLRPPERQPDAAPSMAVAVFERAVSHSALEQRVEASPAIKLAAAKAAEMVVIRSPELAVGRGAERQLGKRELMRLSKDIKVDGVPLKEIYKANKIDEVGLRSVVDTYLRGGDVRQQLAEEIVVKEQTYERDPVLRHQRMIGERKVNSRAGGGRRSGGAGGVGQTLAHALGSAAASTSNTARSAGRAIASGAKTAQRDIIDNSNTTDWLSVTAVVVLYSIILMLLLT